MVISDSDVTDLLRERFRRLETRRPVWKRHRAAFKSEFWTDHSWGGLKDLDVSEDGLPFKVEVNRIQPFVSAQVANLFYRSPRSTAELPNVFEPTAGAPKKMGEYPDIVTAYLDEWMKLCSLQRVSTKAYELAMMYDCAALKLGIDMKRKKGTIINRSWLQSVPPWECVWDEEADDADQQAYRGHLRWERIDRAKEIVDDDLDGVKPQMMSDFLDVGQNGVSSGKRLNAYVRLLEFYDLIAMKQRFYVVEGNTTGNARMVGEEGDIPYEMPDGSPGIPLLPVVLSSVPEFPMQGVPAVGRVYQLNSEQNLLLTILANAMRRDVGRVVLHDDAIGDEVLSQIMRGRDLELIKIDKGGGGSLASHFHPLQFQPVSPTVDKYMNHLAAAWSSTQGTSDLQQGKGLKYATARESDLLAMYGEAASSDLQARMAEVISDAAELQLVMTAEHMKADGVSVRVGAEFKRLTKEIAAMPWSVGVVDSASTPAKDQRKREAFVTIQPVVMVLTQQAAGMPDPATGKPTLSEAAMRQAQEQLNYIVQVFQLPETMSWDAISGKLPTSKDEGKVQKAEVASLLQRIPAHQGLQGPPPEVP